MKRNYLLKVLIALIGGLLFAYGAYAQSITVKGTVKDTAGESIIGANVVVKGTTNGTITDLDGHFQLDANKGNIIVISFIGYQSQELPAAPVMNVVLKEDTEQYGMPFVVLGTDDPGIFSTNIYNEYARAYLHLQECGWSSSERLQKIGEIHKWSSIYKFIGNEK